MQQMNVKFNDVDQIRQFVNIIDKYDVDFDLGAGQRIVDAKSILGVMALDFSGPLRLRYDSEDVAIKEKIMPFLC
ncbi:MAG: HPr family phosphocarrier protein [Lachnospiraceae bacterium]|nr:HPr family phosphocarrier protein [Lachnospiraceae bacterium]